MSVCLWEILLGFSTRNTSRRLPTENSPGKPSPGDTVVGHSKTVYWHALCSIPIPCPTSKSRFGRTRRKYNFKTRCENVRSARDVHVVQTEYPFKPNTHLNDINTTAQVIIVTIIIIIIITQTTWLLTTRKRRSARACRTYGRNFKVGINIVPEFRLPANRLIRDRRPAAVRQTSPAQSSELISTCRFVSFNCTRVER